MSAAGKSGAKQPSASGAVAPGLKLWPVGFGQPARETLQRLIAEAKADDPLAPVTVITTDGGGISLLRKLAMQIESGLIAVSGKVLSDVAEDLLDSNPDWDPAWLTKYSASNMMLSGVIRKVLATDKGLFAGVSHHLAMEKSMLSVANELSDLDDEQLDQVKQCSSRAAAVVDLYRRLQKELAANNLYVRADVLRQAVKLLSSDSFNAVALKSLGTVVVYLPVDLKIQQSGFLKALAEHAPVHVVAGVTGDADADKLYQRMCDRLDLDAEQPLAEQPESDLASRPLDDRIVSVSDADDEVRWVVRSVMDDLASGVSARQIAILYPVTTPYARLVREQLDRAEINWHGSSARRLSESVVGHFVAGFAELVGTDMPRAAFFEVIASGSVIHKQGGKKKSSGKPVPAAAWERIARTANVVDGDDWKEKLWTHKKALAEQLEQQAASDDYSEAWLDRKRNEIALCEQLRSFATGFKAKLDRASVAKTWTEFCEQVKDALSAYLDISASGKPQDGSKRSWARWQIDAAAAIARELKQLKELETIEDKPQVQVMCQALTEMLDQPTKSRNSSGKGVFVGMLDSGADLVATHVYVLGMAEGTCPTRRRPDSMITEEERQSLGDALPTTIDAILEQHHALLAVLAGVKSQQGSTTLLYPRGDLRNSSSNVPSRWLLDTARALEQQNTSSPSLFTAGYIDEKNLTAAASGDSIPAITAIASFTGGLLSASFPATRQEYEAAELLSEVGKSQRPHEIVTKHPLYQNDSALALGVDLTSSRRGHKFTRFDGNLKERKKLSGLEQAVFGESISASSLENWAKCPRAFFFEKLLRVNSIDEPDSLLRMGPLEKGTIVHSAIDQFFKSLLGDDQSPGPDRPYTKADKKDLIALARKHIREVVKQGLAGHPFYAKLDSQQIESDIAEFLDRDAQREFERGTVIASEHRFGLSPLPEELSGETDSALPVSYELPGGGVLKLRGSIDRVELLPRKEGGKNRLSVIDYKTGKSSYYSKNKKDPTQAGTRLQLAVYAIAAAAYFRSLPGVNLDDEWSDAVGQAIYWFITSDPGGWTTVEQKLSDFRELIDEVLLTIHAGISGGIFPGHPPVKESSGTLPCPYCSPDSLSTRDLRKQWETKREDAVLSKYADLAEPLETNV